MEKIKQELAYKRKELFRINRMLNNKTLNYFRRKLLEANKRVISSSVESLEKLIKLFSE